MALVIKSWNITSQAAAGQPYVQIVARKAGLVAYLLSLLGIDATVSFEVTARHVFFGTGSLAGFNRRYVPLNHIASTFYGLSKPWKTTVAVIVLSLMLGISLIGVGSRATTVIGTLVLFGGVGIAVAIYFLNKSLTIGFTDVSGLSSGLAFKTSVIEGQQIDENATEGVIQLIEHLIKPTQGAPIPPLAMGSNAGSPPKARPATRCPGCQAPIAIGDTFCGGCGNQLALSPA